MSPRVHDLLLRDGARMLDGEVVPPPPKHLADAPVVVADDVSKWYWESTQDTWSFLEDFGPLRPPFDQMWVQWKIPAMVHIDGVRRPGQTSDVLALFIVEAEEDGVNVWASAFMAPRPDRRPAALGSTATFKIDGDGRLRTFTGTDQTQTWVLLHPSHLGCFEGDSRDWVANDFKVLFHVPFLAISLMHCKNVPVDERSNMPNARSRKKYRIPERTVSVVRVPAALRSGGGNRRDAAGEVQPLHLVRGHFKTYTDEAPLFGKVTGTYWWGWQARGNEKAGQRDHVYEVQP